MISLHRDPIHEGEHIDDLPRWLAPIGGGAYWHVPRSAHRLNDGTLLVSFWCGPFRRYASEPSDLNPPAEMKCGTCVGRSLGYRRDGGLIFRPRDHWKLPARCPGDDWEEGTRNCFACGRQTNWARREWGIAYHRPDAALAERFAPCLLHGWSRMSARDGLLVCTSWRCSHGENS